MLPCAVQESLPSGPNADLVCAYHERTKHHLERYARGPETLDWDSQPSPFRTYTGSARRLLPLLSELPAHDAAQARLSEPFRLPRTARVPLDALDESTLGVLLQLSLGLTAYKAYGPDRWALRANPSSGNLHPVEAYVVAEGLSWLDDGVYHYCPAHHALERRARFLGPKAGDARAFIGLTSLMWREAWKYGERAFRYCQLDVGHAVGALGVAGHMLGLAVREERALGAASLAQLLGVDPEDGHAPRSEREEPELLLALEWCTPAPDAQPLTALLARSQAASLEGTPSRIDPDPRYAWPAVDQVAHATREPQGTRGASGTERADIAPQSQRSSPHVAPCIESARKTSEVLLGRRSAQRFDPHHVLSRDAFCALLAALLPRPTAPFSALEAAPRIDLALFVHRVEGLESGLYLLPRCGEQSLSWLGAQLSTELRPAQLEMPSGLPLHKVRAAAGRELMRVARALHCHQDIAATSCFALGMLAPLRAEVALNPARYRDLHREAGLIGQVLYLAAEAQGLRGTGIGCFFDDAVSACLGLEASGLSPVYHFTVGKALEDSRISLEPPYPEPRRR